MRIKLFVSHVRQRGSITPASLSAGSTWHARPLAASACAVVPAADVAQVTAGRLYAPCGILLTNTRDSGRASPTEPYAAGL